MKLIQSLLLVICILCSMSYTADAQDWTDEEQEIVGNFFSKVSQKYGRMVLKPEEWREMYLVDSVGVKFFAKKVNLPPDVFIELMEVEMPETPEKRKAALNAFLLKYPDYAASAEEAIKEKQKEEGKKKTMPSWQSIKEDYAKSGEEDMTPAERARFNAAQQMMNNKNVDSAMTIGMGNITDMIDMDKINETPPAEINMFDIFKDGAMKDSMAQSAIRGEMGNSSLINEQEVASSIYNPNNYVFSKSVREALAKPSKSEKLYNLILTQKGKLLENQRRYKRKINQSGNQGNIALLKSWQEKVELYRLKKRDRIGKTTEEWANSMSKTEMAETYDKLTRAIPMEKAKVHNWKAIKSQLDPKEAAIEIIRYKEDKNIHYAFLIIRPDLASPALVVLENGKELETTLLKKYNKGRAKAKLNNALYTAYWKKIQDQLSGIKKIYLSVDGVYQTVNVNLFNTSADPSHFLIDDLSVEYVFSTQYVMRKKTKREEKSKRDILLFGSPNYDLALDASQINSESYSLLDYTKSEVEAIEQIFSKASHATNKYIDNEAREHKIKKAKPGILHIASHAFFDKIAFISRDLQRKNEQKNKNLPEHNQLSNTVASMAEGDEKIDPYYRAGIAFAGANTVEKQPSNKLLSDDGVLFASEIEHLDLSNTELVFLNACNSGKGDISFGEGVYGLQRAFFSAGTESIIISHMKVGDDIGGRFAQLFYNKWINEGKTKQDAFREAQIELKTQLGRGTALKRWGNFRMISI